MKISDERDETESEVFQIYPLFHNVKLDCKSLRRQTENSAVTTGFKKTKRLNKKHTEAKPCDQFDMLGHFGHF